MKRKAILFLLLATLSLSLMGCKKEQEVRHQNTKEETTKEEKEEKQKKEEKKTPDTSKEALEEEAQKDAKIKVKQSTYKRSVFRLNGTVYSLPFSYARIMDDWSFDLADYDLDEDFKLTPGQRTTDNIVLTNPKVDYKLDIGLYNPYDVNISVKEAMVYAIHIDITNTKKKPSLSLPGGIRWKDSIIDVTLAYSDPTVPFTHDLEEGLYHYSYITDYKHYLNLNISEENGLTGFSMKCYE
ncbi:MAG: hypothetical protein K6A30_04295 [Lachnospiraceae bacterium]|nr:hypothetical protein [Lachnospiraceae bacterium]